MRISNKIHRLCSNVTRDQKKNVNCLTHSVQYLMCGEPSPGGLMLPFALNCNDSCCQLIVHSAVVHHRKRLQLPLVPFVATGCHQNHLPFPHNVRIIPSSSSSSSSFIGPIDIDWHLAHLLSLCYDLWRYWFNASLTFRVRLWPPVCTLRFCPSNTHTNQSSFTLFFFFIYGHR